jgi:glycine oxidase
MFSSYQETAVIGAGICGRLIALRLAMNGHRVALFEAHELKSRRSCSAAAAGMLSPISEAAYGDTDLLDLGLESLNMWRDLGQQFFHNEAPIQEAPINAQLSRAEGVTVTDSPKILFKGTLILAHHQHQEEIREFQKRLDQKTGSFPINCISQNELFELEPTIAQTFDRGLYIPQEGHINTWSILDQLAEHLLTAGVIIRENSFVSEVSPGKVTFHDQENFHKTIHFDTVFDCRGYGAKKEMHGLRGVRGESLIIKIPHNIHQTLTVNRPLRILHPRYPIYIVPRTPDIMVVGATMVESESLEPITVGASLELMTALYHAHEAFKYASIVDTMTALRPTLPHHHPRIVCEPGLIRVNGLFRHGFLLAPIVAKTAVSFYQKDPLNKKQKELIYNKDSEEFYEY